MSNYERINLNVVVDLINTWDPYFDEPEQLSKVGDLVRFLRERQIDYPETVTTGDLEAVHKLRSCLRRFVETDSETEAVQILNGLLRMALVTPFLSWEENFQLDFLVNPDIPIADRLAIETALILCFELTEFGRGRLKICDAQPCVEVFVDKSKNQIRRFCGIRCSNRYNVANYRKRLKAQKHMRKK